MSQIAGCNAHSLGKKENPLKLPRRNPPVEKIAGLLVLLAAANDQLAFLDRHFELFAHEPGHGQGNA